MKRAWGFIAVGALLLVVAGFGGALMLMTQRSKLPSQPQRQRKGPPGARQSLRSR